jgi:hypothetical protein
VSGGYWHPSYNVSGWRNCASFNRRLVQPTDFAALLRSYHRHASPIERSVYKRGLRGSHSARVRHTALCALSSLT